MEAWWVLVRAVDAVILKKALAKSGSGGGIVPLPLQSAPDGLSVEGVDALVAFARDFDKAAIEEKSRAPADPDDYLFRALEEVEGDLNGKKPLKGEEI